MHVMRRIVTLVAAIALTFAVVVPVAATRGQPDAPVPFRMHVVGYDRPLELSPGFPFVGDTFGGRCSLASTWVTTIDSVGMSAHLGRVSVTQSHCTRFDIFSAPPQLGPFADGDMVVTAANGDELWIDYSGSFLFYPNDPETGVSMITYDSMTIVGGTGRFEGASGTVHGSAVDNFPQGPNTADFSGSITYDASGSANR